MDNVQNRDSYVTFVRLYVDLLISSWKIQVKDYSLN
jgi:hypothetical protein